MSASRKPWHVPEPATLAPASSRRSVLGSQRSGSNGNGRTSNGRTSNINSGRGRRRRLCRPVVGADRVAEAEAEEGVAPAAEVRVA